MNQDKCAKIELVIHLPCPVAPHVEGGTRVIKFCPVVSHAEGGTSSFERSEKMRHGRTQNEILPGRLMVGRSPLEAAILVRIQAGQHTFR